MHQNLFYQIALTLIPGIGPVKAKLLVTHCGSAEAVFREKPSSLLKIPDVGKHTVQLVTKKQLFEKAETEIAFIEKNQITPLFFTDKKYPERLKLCEDSPILLYAKGRMNLNEKRVISVVGTRNATSYGKGFCKELIEGVAHLKPLVVSGLAYGIDVCAHRNAIAEKLQTVACVAHGHEKVYPPMHTTVAYEMMNHGGLLTEFISNTRMTPELFPMRNRIIAGLADCTIIVETDTKGGSIITAHLANSYGREVFAIPGRCHDKHSTGCNELIRKNIAAILTSPEELIDYMNWGKEPTKVNKQIPLFQELSIDENSVVQLLTSNGKIAIDDLSEKSGLAFTKLSNILLELEFKGIIKTLPGKLYEMV